MRAGQVAELVEGVLEGDAEHEFSGLASLSTAGPGQLSFLAHARNKAELESTQAAGIIVGRKLWHNTGCRRSDLIRIYVADAMWAMACVYEVLHSDKNQERGQHPTCDVHPTAQVHPTAILGAYAVIAAHASVAADAKLLAHSYVGQHAAVGRGTVLHAGARVLWGCSVGDRCILHAGAVVGADGFGFAQNPHGVDRKKIPQLGHVIVGNDVELGANSTIDRATFGATTVGDGCKIDNLVQVGHNVTLGKHCVVASQTGIAGSAVLGDAVTVGAQAGIVGHLTIAPKTVLAARTGVISSLKQPGVYAGAPAMEHRAWLRMVAAMRDLGGMRRRLLKMTKQASFVDEAH